MGQGGLGVRRMKKGDKDPQKAVLGLVDLGQSLEKEDPKGDKGFLDHKAPRASPKLTSLR